MVQQAMVEFWPFLTKLAVHGLLPLTVILWDLKQKGQLIFIKLLQYNSLVAPNLDHLQKKMAVYSHQSHGHSLCRKA